MHEIMNIIVRMRLGESDRQLAKAGGLIGRIKAAKIGSLADEKGWLDKSVELPRGLQGKNTENFYFCQIPSLMPCGLALRSIKRGKLQDFA